ncbi:hypothetical protein P280DRAFT_515413 [Massarina eburnea CBS 473.64]|uniref:Uncharacterized protein n=1 Tax=Massarina eburnea CBS 473.64 TaxID=1395130 RepID=A0A6A6S964_9PLEO|nr:hypothetical protein P280DRAFT_515413 [Massarina eburnea CBS 473.64]
MEAKWIYDHYSDANRDTWAPYLRQASTATAAMRISGLFNPHFMIGSDGWDVEFVPKTSFPNASKRFDMKQRLATIFNESIYTPPSSPDQSEGCKSPSLDDVSLHAPPPSPELMIPLSIPGDNEQLDQFSLNASSASSESTVSLNFIGKTKHLDQCLTCSILYPEKKVTFDDNPVVIEGYLDSYDSESDDSETDAKGRLKALLNVWEATLKKPKESLTQDGKAEDGKDGEENGSSVDKIDIATTTIPSGHVYIGDDWDVDKLQKLCNARGIETITRVWKEGDFESDEEDEDIDERQAYISSMYAIDQEELAFHDEHFALDEENRPVDDGQAVPSHLPSILEEEEEEEEEEGETDEPEVGRHGELTVEFEDDDWVMVELSEPTASNGEVADFCIVAVEQGPGQDEETGIRFDDDDCVMVDYPEDFESDDEFFDTQTMADESGSEGDGEMVGGFIDRGETVPANNGVEDRGMTGELGSREDGEMVVEFADEREPGVSNNDGISGSRTMTGEQGSEREEETAVEFANQAEPVASNDAKAASQTTGELGAGHVGEPVVENIDQPAVVSSAEITGLHTMAEDSVADQDGKRDESAGEIPQEAFSGLLDF